MTTITYKRAEVEDTPIIVENRLKFALELTGPQDQTKIDSLHETVSAYFRKATANSTCISIIAYVDNEVAGIGSVCLREMPGNFKNPSGRWGYIMNMYTVPNYRRKGICKGILQHLVEEGKKLGITAYELHATAEGEKVYLNNGFDLYPEPTYRMYQL